MQAGGAEPAVGHLKPLVNLAQDLAFVQPAVVEFENAVGVAPVRDVAVAVAHGEAFGAFFHEEGGDLLLGAARGVFFACRHKDDGKACKVGVADEMLGAVQDPVIAVLAG